MPLAASDLEKALRARYAKPEFLTFFNVRDGGSSGKRTADALALNVWEGRGQELHGFEVKVSRSDWLRELRQPAKAERIQRFCDRWWLVTGGRKNFTDPAEIPEPWGHLHLAEGETALEVIKMAPRRTPHKRPWTFVVQLIRSLEGTYAEKWIPREMVAAELEAKFAAGEECGRRLVMRNVEDLERRAAQYAAFLNSLGLDAWQIAHDYHGGTELGAAFNALLNLLQHAGKPDPLHALEYARNQASAFVRGFDIFQEEVRNVYADLAGRPALVPGTPPAAAPSAEETSA